MQNGEFTDVKCKILKLDNIGECICVCVCVSVYLFMLQMTKCPHKDSKTWNVGYCGGSPRGKKILKIVNNVYLKV